MSHARNAAIPLVLVCLVGSVAKAHDPHRALELLSAYLSTPTELRTELAAEAFADVPLSYQQAALAADALWNDSDRRFRDAHAGEWLTRSVTIDGRTMKLDFRVIGQPEADPATSKRPGRRLFISMHGGGNAAPEVNDQQWKNQVRLYEPEEGVYLAPRAPTDTWNLWHEPHIDALFDRIIEDAVAFEGVDPDRVYLMGYSAGGDGVYQLAPRMADRFAAAAMMAGHPNEARPDGLRNLPFAIHMGANDGAYDRNKVASAWGARLDELQAADPEGYIHLTKLHEGKGHWMDREDAEAVPWMSRFTREPWPNRVVWRQDDVTHGRLYWLSVGDDARVPGAIIEARFEEINDEQRITIERAEGFGERESIELTLLLSDELLNLDRPLIVTHGEHVLYQGIVFRTIRAMADGLAARQDRAMLPTASLTVTLPLGPGSDPDLANP